ncbi:hypothetical protein GUJ93_ZPchr0012g20674 [Zizania palustris]|uniref:TPX2 C-terminal domain-containing protein n=1 Tax=Zizania palustris TaxID=103762 RepID=A0A8J5WRJ0_ZIZPA|nr:hypothetical protein GUJ93_ZPchr0012g20674 [Zizania palustris]
MGAEMDLSPPPPEPARSPDPEILGRGHQSWKAEMMSALGESVSFGRFLAEPLEWGKWSAFEHNRYIEEATHQSRPGSVAQKKAFFEAHYARKRKSDDDAAADGDGDAEHEEVGGGAAASSARSSSSCMTDEPAVEETSCVGSVAAGCGGSGSGSGDGVVAAVPVEPFDVLEAITNGVGSSCTVDEVGELRPNLDDVLVGEARDGLQVQKKQEFASQDPCAGNFVAVDNAADKQPLKESSIVNLSSTESVKRRRLPSLLQKPAKFSSPPSGNKGLSSSAKRRSRLHSAKENSSPPNNESNRQSTSSVPQNRSTMEAFQKSKNIFRCETGSAASSSKNLGCTIAARISQLESATMPVKHTHSVLGRVKPSREEISKDVPEIASRTSQMEEQRYSHVTRVKEKLFSLTSASVHQKTNTSKEKVGKPQNEPDLKEARQSFCFKARPLPNFYRKNKQVKEPSQQVKGTSTVLSIERTRDRPAPLYR